MTGRHLIVLTVAALLALVAALWTSNLRDSADDSEEGALLVPQLEDRLNEVTALRIRKQGTEAEVVVERGEANWLVTDKAGYPADIAKVRKLLLTLAEARLLEAKTANPANHARLGLGTMSDEDGAGTRLAVDLPDATPALDLIIGDTARGNSATYVRHAEDPQAWLVSGDLSVAGDPLEWLDRELVDLPKERIQAITVTHADGEKISVVKADREQDNFTFSETPEGRELRYDTVADTMVTAVRSLRLDDVGTAGTDVDADTSLDSVASTEYRTFDGLVLTAETIRLGEDRYTQFSAEFDPDQYDRYAPAQPESAATNGADAAEEATADGETVDDRSGAEVDTPFPEKDTVRAEAADLQRRLGGWRFKLPDYKHDQMTKRIEDLLKPLEEATSDS